MKKWLCGLLVLVMLVLTCSVGFGEATVAPEEGITEEMFTEEIEEVLDNVKPDQKVTSDEETEDAGYEHVEFTPELISGIDSTAAQWFYNSKTRAAFFLALIIDAKDEVEDKFDLDTAIASDSYVAKMGYVLIVWIQSEDNDLLLFCSPELGMASYAIIDHLGSDALIEETLSQIADEYYKPDEDELMEVVQDMSEATN